MDLNWLVERVYNESDPGRGIATSAAGTTGLTTYLYWEDWVVAGFVTIIVFPIGRILASAIHSHWNQSRERNRSMDQLKDLFDKFGSEERAVIQAFVWRGGSVITWSECNQSPHFFGSRNRVANQSRSNESEYDSRWHDRNIRVRYTAVRLRAEGFAQPAMSGLISCFLVDGVQTGNSRGSGCGGKSP